MRVLMNSTNGVKLLTGGKKCLEDIEVVPNFEMSGGGTPALGTMTIKAQDGIFMGNLNETAFVTVWEDGEVVQKTIALRDYTISDDGSDIATTLENVVIGSIAVMYGGECFDYSEGLTLLGSNNGISPYCPCDRGCTMFMQVTSPNSVMYFHEA